MEAQHVNEVHVTEPTVPPTGYVLQVSVLPHGTTDDYSSHNQQAINDVCQTYSLHHHLPEAAVVSQVVNHMYHVGQSCGQPLCGREASIRFGYSTTRAEMQRAPARGNCQEMP